MEMKADYFRMRSLILGDKSIERRTDERWHKTRLMKDKIFNYSIYLFVWLCVRFFETVIIRQICEFGWCCAAKNQWYNVNFSVNHISKGKSVWLMCRMGWWLMNIASHTPCYCDEKTILFLWRAPNGATRHQKSILVNFSEVTTPRTFINRIFPSRNKCIRGNWNLENSNLLLGFSADARQMAFSQSNSIPFSVILARKIYAGFFGGEEKSL